MPLKGTYNFSAPPTKPAAPEPSFLDRLGGIPGVLAGGTRALTGVLSSEGFLPGAAISGLGELGAEALEGSLFKQSIPRTMARVGTSAGIGAVPFGAVLKAGRPLASAARGALYSGGGEAVREAAAGEDISPSRVATSGAMGGVLTGGLSKLFGGGKSAVPTNREDYLAWKGRGYKPEAAAEPFVVEPTAQTGPGTTARIGGKISKKGELTGSKPTPSLAPKPIIPEGMPGRPVEPMPGGEATGAYSGEAPAPYRAAAKQGIAAEEKAAKLAEKEAGELRKREEIQRNMEELGLVPKTPSISSSISTKVGDKTLSQRIGYSKPKGAASTMEEIFGEDFNKVGDTPAPTAPLVEAPPSTPMGQALTPKEARAASYAALEAKLKAEAPTVPGEPVISPIEPPPGQPSAAPGVEPVQTGAASPEGGSSIVEAARPPAGAPTTAPIPPESPLAQFFKTRVGATGKNYREARKAEGFHYSKGQWQRNPDAPQGPTSAYARDAHLIEQGKAPVGPFAPPTAPEVPSAATGEPWVQEQLNLIDSMKALGQKAKGTKGEINPMLATRLGLGAGGALIGGATDPLGGDTHTPNSRLGSALLGFGAGAALPSIPGALRSIGASAATLSTPEGVKQAASKIYHKLPEVQRFNYLLSAEGLPANVIAGPVGSGFNGALEAALSGDPRGWTALKELRNPANLIADIKQSFNEAKGMIGRAEGTAMSSAPNPMEAALAMPGTLMTTGDVSIRKILERAGFSADEARRMTLTSEPEFKMTKRLASLTKGSPLMQMLFPFTRTPANILEQGAERLPGIGSIVQANRAVPDPMKQQLVQQGMSTAIGTGAGVLGANLDPETAKIAKRYVSNAGGQYSLPANIGFTVGQAIHQGKPSLTAAATSLAQGIPLPTADPIIDWSTWADKMLAGESAPPPPGAMPKDLADFLFPKKKAALPKLTPLPRIKR